MTVDTAREVRSSPLLGAACVVGAAALWAIAAAVARDLFEAGVEPLELAAARSFVAAAGLSLVGSAWRGTGGGRPVLVAALGVAIALVNATYYIAIDHLAVAVAIVLQYTGPAMLVAWVASRTRSVPPRGVITAVVAALLGVALVSELPAGDLGQLDLVGIGAGLASAALFATYTLLSEAASGVYGPVGALRRAFTAASLFWIALMLVRGWPAELFEPSNLWRVLFVGVLGTLAPFWLYLQGVHQIKAERASIVATSEPVLAALVAWTWLGEALSAMQIAGGLLVIAAIVMLEATSHRAVLAPER
jgi:drug/metabolite transporter, DME family